MIAAILLSAGESRRMGSPKALLPYSSEDGMNETTFIGQLLDVFARSRAEPVIVVLGHDAPRLREAVEWGTARVVVNERYRDGMLSSIRAGVAALGTDEAVEGALVCPVDHPEVRTEVVDRLIAEFDRFRAPVVLPVFQGRRGHPVLFSRAVFAELERAPDAVGARQVVWDHQEELLEVEVSDPGVKVDIDTPEDYRALRGEDD